MRGPLLFNLKRYKDALKMSKPALNKTNSISLRNTICLLEKVRKSYNLSLVA